MTAGPLVVFGFLVLPALAALRVAPGLASAFAISARDARRSRSWAASGSPTGRTCPRARCASPWWRRAGRSRAWRMRLRARPRRGRAARARWSLLASFARLARLRDALRGSRRSGGARRCRAARCPSRVASRPVAVLPFENATGQPLRMSQGLLKDAERAVGDPPRPSPTVPDLLQQRAAFELQRRGFAVVPVELPAALPSARRAARRGRAAAEAGLAGSCWPARCAASRSRETRAAAGAPRPHAARRAEPAGAVDGRREAAGADPLRAHAAGGPARRRAADLRRRLREPLDERR